MGYGGFISGIFANQLSCLILERHITSYCICMLLTLCLAALKKGKDRSRASTMLNRYRPPSAHQQELQMSCIGQAAQKQSDPSAQGSAWIRALAENSAAGKLSYHSLMRFLKTLFEDYVPEMTVLSTNQEENWDLNKFISSKLLLLIANACWWPANYTLSCVATLQCFCVWRLKRTGQKMKTPQSLDWLDSATELLVCHVGS